MVHHSLYKEYEDRYYYKYVCASFRNPPRPQVAKTQMIKVIVLLIVAMTICSCGWKPIIICDFDDTSSILKDCVKRPQLGISKEF